MALQDLTPQLRTRLGRVERAVGFFVGLASLLLLAGFTYYVHHTAQRKGWYLTKAPYFTYVTSASGLAEGTPVKLMGMEVGEITKVAPMPPDQEYNIYVEFLIREPNYGYIWDNSEVKVLSSDFLGGRYLEVTKGTTNANGSKPHPSYNVKDGIILEMYDDKSGQYAKYIPGKSKYQLVADDPPPIADRLSSLVQEGEKALPNILGLTNQLAQVLSNANRLTVNYARMADDLGPSITNLNTITAQLRNPQGSLGDWLIPTNLSQQLQLTLATSRETLTGLQGTLTNADSLLTNVNMVVSHTDTNLLTLVTSLNDVLESISGMTSNLNTQVQANTNILTEISTAVVHADDLVQGLKRHWLLRSAFKTNAPPARPETPKKR